MSNVVSMHRPREYMIHKAAARRHSGQYDEAMALLTKAKDQFGFDEEIELEMARVYDEMECEEEAARSYLRVVRANGKFCVEALFHLTISCAQHGDVLRAASYFEAFAGQENGSSVTREMTQMLGYQLHREMERPMPTSQRRRSSMLVRRAVECMQAGKLAAAKRTLHHALSLYPSVRGQVMLACCYLLRGEYDNAVLHACVARKMAPSRVQTLCVLTDAYASAGDEQHALRTLYIAAMRSKEPDDQFNVAIESAKRGQNQLTLLLTRAILKREPFDTRAMMLRACAWMNLGKFKQASRLFGRLCGLLPENTVCEALYKAAREEMPVDEQLTLGLDVTRKEGVSRASQMVSALYANPQTLREDKEQTRALCRMASWAFRSPLAGEQVATVALLLMSMMQSEASREVLLDALTDPQVDDGLKCKILQVMMSDGETLPYPVDMGGRLVRLAAGSTIQGKQDSDLCGEIVQRAADALSAGFKDAPRVILKMWIAYLHTYKAPDRKHAAVCVAALEYAYHAKMGNDVDMDCIARRECIPRRLCRVYVNRLLKCNVHTDGE